MNTTVPVILLNYNTSADCRKCLSFLARQKGVRVVPVVVDNCSRHDDLAEVRALCADEGCVLLEAKENRGYNAGNNIGLRWSAEQGYKYALIANPDMEFPQTEYVARLVAAMEQDEQAAVIGSDIVGVNGEHQNPMRELGYREELLWPVAWLLRVFRRKDDAPWKETGVCSKLSGCCLLIRLSFLKDIGFFDEGVFLYCEESILAKQVAQQGRQCYYLATATAVHRHVKSQKASVASRMKISIRSRVYFYHTYCGCSRIAALALYVSKRLHLLVKELLHKI